MLQFFVCVWLRNFMYWFFVRWASIDKDNASSGVYGTKLFLAWTTQAFLIFNSLVGAVSNASLKILAASLLPADSRLVLDVWVSWGKPLVFRSSFDFLRLLLRCSLQTQTFDDHFYLQWVGFRHLFLNVLAILLILKLISCSNHSALFDKNTNGFFLRQSTFTKCHYKHEIYRDEFLLMHSEIFLLAQSEL